MRTELTYCRFCMAFCCLLLRLQTKTIPIKQWRTNNHIRQCSGWNEIKERFIYEIMLLRPMMHSRLETIARENLILRLCIGTIEIVLYVPCCCFCCCCLFSAFSWIRSTVLRFIRLCYIGWCRCALCIRDFIFFSSTKTHQNFSDLRSPVYCYRYMESEWVREYVLFSTKWHIQPKKYRNNFLAFCWGISCSDICVVILFWCNLFGHFGIKAQIRALDASIQCVMNFKKESDTWICIEFDLIG